MTLKEMMMGNIQSGQGTAVLQVGAQSVQKYGSKSKNTTFGELLGNSMSNADGHNSVKGNDSNVSESRINSEQTSSKADNKPRFLSFRAANERKIEASASKSTASNETIQSGACDSRADEVEDASESTAASKNQTSSMLYIFAQVLGLDIKDLQKLLKEADITPESFSSVQSLTENASKLSQLLGLSNEQQGTLVKTLQLTCETLNALTAVQTEAAGEEILPSDTKSTAGVETNVTQLLSAAEGSNEALQETSAFETLAAKLGLEIKIRLNEFSTKLAVDQNAVKAELEQLIQHLSGKTANEKQQPLKQPLQQIVEADISDNAVQTVTADDTEVETAAAQDDTGQETNAKAENETVILQPAAGKQTQPQAAFAVAQPGKIDDTNVIEMAAAKAPVAPKEIISQVIEQAKVILTPEKSEMSMDLKPDSLGKISLKVVTENGIVMAKFVAESHQVRQVLETNMQLLKDSLEKQGMLVQGFSVSVRQDSNQSGRSWTKPQNGNNRNITGTAYRTAGIESSLTDVMEAAGRENPYQWGSSTINLTA